MKEKIIGEEVFRRYEEHMTEEEKSDATKEKYLRDIKAFAQFCGDAGIDKGTVVAYKQKLIDEEYAPRSINSMLASLNGLFSFLGWYDLRVKSLTIQQQVYIPEEQELSRPEYERLCRTAEKKNDNRLSLIIQTICSTGIRVSELRFITSEAVRAGKAEVSLKKKTRTVFIVNELKKKLLHWIREQDIRSGPVFLSKNGTPIGRTEIWRQMKKLCFEADVNPKKVFPHNLRHLFARVFYELEKDIAKLADILGHSSINTTRIYIISTGLEHRRRMERMRLTI